MVELGVPRKPLDELHEAEVSRLADEVKSAELSEEVGIFPTRWAWIKKKSSVNPSARRTSSYLRVRSKAEEDPSSSTGLA